MNTVRVAIFLSVWIPGIFHHLTIFAQCFHDNFAFGPGEKINYEVSYNWGPIWIDAGEGSISVKNFIYLNKPVYRLEATGGSLKNFDWFYKVRDQFVTYLDIQNLNPVKSEKNSYEGGHVSYENYIFNHPERKIYSATASSEEPFKKDTLEMKGCYFDLLTACYYARNINFSNYRLNEKLPITVLVDDSIFNITIKFLGKEQISTPDKQKYNCLKFSSSSIEGSVFKSGENIFVWVSDDLNHIPIYIEAKILVGSVKIYMKTAENLRNPFTSKTN